MVGHMPLKHVIGVRVPDPQQKTRFFLRVGSTGASVRDSKSFSLIFEGIAQENGKAVLIL